MNRRTPHRDWNSRARRWAAWLRRAFVACLLLGVGGGPVAMADDPPPAVSSASGVIPLDRTDPLSIYDPRISVLYQTGDGVGYDEGFWSLQSFVPLARWEDDQLVFVDLHGLFDEDGALGGNFGIGRRFYSETLGATVGAYVYYDFRDTGVNQFQQLSPGLDIYFDHWQLHANGYLPRLSGTRKDLPDQFRGNLLFLERFESAMDGGDIELGTRLPMLQQWQPKLFAGAYHFRTTGRQNATGWKAGLQASMSDTLSMAVSVQDDQVFGTTANLGVEFRFPAPKSFRSLRDICGNLRIPPRQRNAIDQLAAPTRRMQQVVIDREDFGEVARDPLGGDPITFLHVAAGTNVDGSFERPYAQLTDARADPRYAAGDIDVIYVRGDFLQTVTHTGNVALVDNTHLLGNGPLQRLGTQLGPRTLPFSGIDLRLSELPKIEGSVTMGNNTTLSGFEIRFDNATGFSDGAVIANGVVGFDINNNVVFNNSAGGAGIQLVNIDVPASTSGAGRIRIANNIAIGSEKQNGIDVKVQQNGIQITGGQRFEGDIVDNVSRENVDSGIFISGVPEFVGNIDGNVLSENDFSGLALLSSNFEGNIRRNVVSRNKNTGLEIVGSGNTFKGVIANNEIDGLVPSTGPKTPATNRIFTVSKKRTTSLTEDTATKNSFGINMQGYAIDAVIRDNLLNNHAWGGIFISESTFMGAITGNTTNGNLADGISVINSPFTGNILNNVANDNLLGGVLINLLPSQSFSGNINGNTVLRNGSQGILVAGGGFTGELAGNNTSFNQASGIIITADAFSGNLTGNTANNNGFDGFLLGSTTVTGSVMNNTALENNENGLFIGNFSSTFSGDVSGNTLGSNMLSGLDMAAGMFTGSIENNIANSNLATGLLVRSAQNITGSVFGNTANMNEIGLTIASQEFFGDITANTLEMNSSHGLFVDVTKLYFGSIFLNTATSNGGTGLQLFLEGITNGDVSQNTSNFNQIGIQITAQQFNGVVLENIAMGNTLEGIDIFVLDSGPTFMESEPNNSLAGAQNIDGAPFTLGANPNITDATTIPHLTIGGTGDGTFDYYSFTANAGDRGIFDIDAQNFDTELFLFDSAGNLLAENDDAVNAFDPGDGEPDFLDSFIDFTFSASDLFVIAVGEFESSASGGEVLGDAPDTGDSYSLHISLENHATGTVAGSNLGILDVVGNQLQGNNGGTGRELVIENKGTGTMCLLFNNNTSLNTVAPGAFNFDFLNTGGGGFDLFQVLGNTGTVGSSNGSVVVP